MTSTSGWTPPAGGKGESPASPRPSVARQRWWKAENVVNSANIMKHSGEERRERLAAVKGVDAFAMQHKPSTWLGAAVTIAVWLATLAYIVVLVIQWKNTPPTKIVGTEWTIGTGPFNMSLTCTARSGCLITNALSNANTLNIAAAVPVEQTQCILLPFGQTLALAVVFSVDPVEGLSVIWDAATAEGTSLAGAGITVISEIRCPTPDAPKDCVIPLLTPVVGGTALLQHVDTRNYTAAGPGVHRREWFVNMIDRNVTVLERSAEGCTAALAASSSTGGGTGGALALHPNASHVVQARLRINSFYNTVDVSEDSFWLFLFGAAGGAYAVFLQCGALLLAMMHGGAALQLYLQSRKSGGNNTPAKPDAAAAAGGATRAQRPVTRPEDSANLNADIHNSHGATVEGKPVLTSGAMRVRRSSGYDPTTAATLFFPSGSSGQAVTAPAANAAAATAATAAAATAATAAAEGSQPSPGATAAAATTAATAAAATAATNAAAGGPVWSVQNLLAMRAGSGSNKISPLGLSNPPKASTDGSTAVAGGTGDGLFIGGSRPGSARGSPGPGTPRAATQTSIKISTSGEGSAGNPANTSGVAGGAAAAGAGNARSKTSPQLTHIGSNNQGISGVFAKADASAPFAAQLGPLPGSPAASAWPDSPV